MCEQKLEARCRKPQDHLYLDGVRDGDSRGWLDLQRVREVMYRSELAADQADVTIAALMTEGSPLIPAREILGIKNSVNRMSGLK
jgi:hypothetical protein